MVKVFKIARFTYVSSNVTRLNISVTQSLRSWMEKTGIIGSWSQDPGLVSK